MNPENGFERLYETARALGEETRFRIYRHLSVSETPTSVSDLAEAFSLHPNAVRQHLARLEQAGLVVSRPHREGGAGRPRRLFQRSPERQVLGRSPRPLGALVSVLADALDDLPAGRDDLVAFGRTWGRAWARRRKRENGAPRSRQARVQLLAGELAHWGWNPSTSVEDSAIRLETRRCLFHASRPGRPDRCCILEEGLLGGLTDGLLNGRAEVSVRGCRLEVSI